MKKLIYCIIVILSVLFVFSSCNGNSGNQTNPPEHEHSAASAVRENEVSATCTSNGSYDEVVYCSECGEELSRESKITETSEHTPAETAIENRVEPTCTSPGSYDEVIRCSDCNSVLSVKSNVIDKIEHTHGEAVVENFVSSTCQLRGGYDEVVYCSVCNEELSRNTKIIEKKSHTPGKAEEENHKDPTYNAPGSYDLVVYCTMCGTVLSRKTVIIDQRQHTPANPVIENRVEPTCQSKGSYDEVVYCSECNELISKNTVVLEILPHTSGAPVVENRKEPTCQSKGGYDEVVYCSDCNELISKNTVVLEVLPHKSGLIVEENYRESTCESKGGYDEVVYCLDCHTELSRKTYTTDKLGHTKGSEVKENSVDATCVSDGSYDLVSRCVNCGVELSRRTIATPAVGHYFVNGVCSYCDAMQASTGLALKLSDDKTYYAVIGIGLCTDLEVVIPAYYNGLPVKEIKQGAFADYNSKITSIYIPETVTNIEVSAFQFCRELTGFTVSKNNPNYKSVDGTIYSKDGKTLVRFAQGSPITTFVLPDSVTHIDDYAFYLADDLLHFESTENSALISIGDSSFYDCEFIRTITLPDTVETMGEFAFYSCSRLESLPSLGKITEIPKGLFGGCYEALREVIIPNGITKIGASAFESCDNLEYIFIPKSVVELNDRSLCTWGHAYIEYEGTEAEWNSKVRQNGGVFSAEYTLVFSDSVNESKGLNYSLSYDGSYYIVKSIGNCKDAWIYIPETYNGLPVKEIASYAFQYNYNIDRVYIPDSVTTVGAGAFYDTNIGKFVIGSGLKTIGESAFASKKLREFDVSPYNSYYKVVDGVLYSKDDSTLVRYPVGADTESELRIEIPYGVSKIAPGAFIFGNNIVDIYIPHGVSVIGAEAFAYTGITEIVLLDGLTMLNNNTFEGCTSLVSVYLPDTLERIGYTVFRNCTSLSYIEIPSSVNYIGFSAFSGCEGLYSITIPAGVSYIGYGAFGGCINLSITCNRFEAHPDWDSNWNPDNLPVTWIQGSEGLEFIEDYGGYYVYGMGSCTDENVIIPATYNSLPVVGIYSYAFEYEWIESITIPSSVRYIYYCAFQNCYIQRVIFEDPDCWRISYSYEEKIMLNGLSDPEKAALYLTETYVYDGWECHTYDGMMPWEDPVYDSDTGEIIGYLHYYWCDDCDEKIIIGISDTSIFG